MKITPTMTRGVQELGFATSALFRIHQYATKRYVQDKTNCFFTFTPNGINVDIGDGNKKIDSALISSININQKLYCIIDDYGEKSKYGLVITILKPDEY